MQDLVHFLEQHLFSCSFKSFLGIECPGCGTQRAFIALLKGDLFLSLRLNASLIPFLLTVFYTILHLRFQFKEGARTIVYSFSFTVAVMVVNFVIKLLSA
jgi:hypothetical protein